MQQWPLQGLKIASLTSDSINCTKHSINCAQHRKTLHRGVCFLLQNHNAPYIHVKMYYGFKTSTFSRFFKIQRDFQIQALNPVSANVIQVQEFRMLPFSLLFLNNMGCWPIGTNRPRVLLGVVHFPNNDTFVNSLRVAQFTKPGEKFLHFNTQTKAQFCYSVWNLLNESFSISYHFFAQLRFDCVEMLASNVYSRNTVYW